MIVEATIPGRPVPKERPRTYHRDRYGRELRVPHTVTPAKTFAAEEVIRWAVKDQNPGLMPTAAPVSVVLCFYGDRLGDIDNLQKLVLDACNGVVWKDDRQVRHIEADIRDGEPRTVLSVESLA